MAATAKESSIPLRSPDGIVYAWACGACHHVQHPGDMLGPLGPEDVAWTAKNALSYADRCCTCPTCHARLLDSSGVTECATCEEASRPAREAHLERIAKEAKAFAARAEAALARSPNPDAAERLVVHMRELSDEVYAAGWLHGLEFTMWEMLQANDTDFGITEITVGDMALLRDLHERAGGWWRWQHEEGTVCAGGPVFVTTEEWLAIVAARKDVAT